MKRTVHESFVILAATLFLFIGPLSTLNNVSAKEMTLRWVIPGPPTVLLHKMMVTGVGNEITRRTGGQIKFDYYWSGSLLAAQDIVQGVRKGIAQFGTTSGIYTLANHPHWSTLNLPGTGTDSWALMRASTDMLQNNKEIRAEFDKLNLVPTHGYASGTSLFIFRKQATTLAEMKGLRVRGFGASTCQLISELGMTPVLMDMFAVYENMERGVIDGSNSTPMFMDSLKLYEVAKYATIFSNGNKSNDITTVINKKLWKSLPPKTRDLILAVFWEYQDKYLQKLIESESALMKRMEKVDGVHFSKPSPEADATYQTACKAVRDAWFKKWDSKGKRTKEVYDQFVAAVAKYEKEVKEKGYPWKR